MAQPDREHVMRPTVRLRNAIASVERGDEVVAVDRFAGEDRDHPPRLFRRRRKLAAFGIISEVIPVFSGKPIYGYDFVAASTLAIAFLSLTVWAHHMFAVGLGHPFDLFFVIGSMAIAVPTGIKIFNWTATMYGGGCGLRPRCCSRSASS